VQVHVYTINPLALSNNELYGSFEEATHEWQDGVLAHIMRSACKDEAPDQKWILFDGPVDTLWIESMNTTLDDNKLLTLLSGGWLWWHLAAACCKHRTVGGVSRASNHSVAMCASVPGTLHFTVWRWYVEMVLTLHCSMSQHQLACDRLRVGSSNITNITCASMLMLCRRAHCNACPGVFAV
jgi:hypothetical protein